MTALCPRCAIDDAGWRDAPMSVVDAGIRWLDNGNNNTVTAALERRKHRAEKYYELVRFQRDLIARQCVERGHQEPVQLPLFEAAA